MSIRHRKNPLPDWNFWNDIVDEMPCCIGHATGGATRTERPSFARIGHNLIFLAVPTAKPGKTIGHNPTGKIFFKFPFQMKGKGGPLDFFFVKNLVKILSDDLMEVGQIGPSMSICRPSMSIGDRVCIHPLLLCKLDKKSSQAKNLKLLRS